MDSTDPTLTAADAKRRGEKKKKNKSWSKLGASAHPARAKVVGLQGVDRSDASPFRTTLLARPRERKLPWSPGKSTIIGLTSQWGKEEMLIRRRGTRTADNCFQPSTVASSPSQSRTNHPCRSHSRADGEVGTGGKVGGRRARDASPPAGLRCSRSWCSTPSQLTSQAAPAGNGDDSKPLQAAFLLTPRLSSNLPAGENGAREKTMQLLGHSEWGRAPAEL